MPKSTTAPSTTGRGRVGGRWDGGKRERVMYLDVVVVEARGVTNLHSAASSRGYIWRERGEREREKERERERKREKERERERKREKERERERKREKERERERKREKERERVILIFNF